MIILSANSAAGVTAAILAKGIVAANAAIMILGVILISILFNFVNLKLLQPSTQMSRRTPSQ
jgi:Zn-dependent membrane protease YugP